jgi:hypothetical protein
VEAPEDLFIRVELDRTAADRAEKLPADLPSLMVEEGIVKLTTSEVRGG